MRTKGILLCVLFSLGLPACASDKGDASKATTTTPTTTAPTIGPRGAARVRNAARTLVLLRSDFPAEWTSAPSDETETPEDEATSKEFSDCVGTSGDDFAIAELEGDDFSMGEYEASSEVVVVESDEVFRRDIDAIQGPKLQPCVKDFFTKLLTKEIGTAPTSVDVAPLEMPKHGDATVGLRMTIVAGAEPARTMYADLVLMGKSPAEVTVSFFSVDQPIDPALETSVVDSLGKRLDAA
ncbi:MAG: hypothetical protein LC808_05315 [Actinobacteria bacterium]|nr:hypothetical protein [Actinomycetota bacterium]